MSTSTKPRTDRSSGETPRVRRASQEKTERRPRKNSQESMGKKKNRQQQDLVADSRGAGRRFDTFRDEAQWNVAQKWAPPRQLTLQELVACRKMFYDLDSDNSGSIDADELGSMMRTLGQDPTEEECKELIASVDDPHNPDGMIQFREFCVLYAQGIDSKDKAGCLDSLNIFTALGGDSKKSDSCVPIAAVKETLLDTFGLDVDLTATFGFQPRPEGLSQDDFKTIISDHPSGRGSTPAAIPA